MAGEDLLGRREGALPPLDVPQRDAAAVPAVADLGNKVDARSEPRSATRCNRAWLHVRTSGSYPSSSLSSHSTAHSSSSSEPASRPRTPPRAASLARARDWDGKRWWVREAGAEGEGAAPRGRLEKEAPRGHFVEHLASSARSAWARAAAMLPLPPSSWSGAVWACGLVWSCLAFCARTGACVITVRWAGLGWAGGVLQKSIDLGP